MSAPENTHLSQSAIVGSLSNQIVALQDENKRLRAALADCGTAVGGIVAPQCSLDFLECVSQEVRLVTERLRRERADALLATERAREERNRVGLDVRREWVGKCIEAIRERDHWKSNHDSQVSRARLLIERGDIPIERVRAYEEMGALRTNAQRFEWASASIENADSFMNLMMQHELCSRDGLLADIDAARTPKESDNNALRA
jgi:hypothetical protein